MSSAGDARRGRIAGKLVRGLALSIGVLAALVLLFEITCRVFSIRGLSRDELDPVRKQLAEGNVQPHPYLAYVPKPDYHHSPTPTLNQRIDHNSLGFRGRETTWAKPPGVFRIVCMGGSSVYGQTETSNATTWPARLEAHLAELLPERKLEVINAGCRGYSTFEMLINFELRLVDFQPDLVIVYESINDMRCALYPGCRNDNTHWRAIWPVERKGRLDRLLERSYTFLAVRRYLTDWLANQANLGRYVMVDFGRYADDYAQPTDVEQGFRNFQRNLVSIVTVARAHGCEVLFATQAMRFSDIQGASSFQAQKEALLRCRRVLGQVADERGVPLVDTAKHLEDELEQQSAAGKRPDDLFMHEVHLTDKGSDMLARYLAQQIVTLKLIP